MNAFYQQIIDTQLPAFRGNIRQQPRKEIAKQVKQLFRSLGLDKVSVTTPNYSMAASIHIKFHVWDETFTKEHLKLHARIEEDRSGDEPWQGLNNYCPHCKQQWAAHEAIKAIVLAAYPDLDDRSDSGSDYFDNPLSIE